MKKRIYYWILITEEENPSGSDAPNQFLNGGYENKKTAIGQAVLFKKNRAVKSVEIFPLPTADAVVAKTCITEFKELKKLFEEQM